MREGGERRACGTCAKKERKKVGKEGKYSSKVVWEAEWRL